MSQLQGMVIDGPVAGARVALLDADGFELSYTYSDEAARFELEYPADALYPVTLRADGGTTLTTGAPPVLSLRAQLTSTPEENVVLSPISSLAHSLAQCELTAEQQAERLQTLIQLHGFGIEPKRWSARPWQPPAGDEEGLRLLIASEALAEALRRTSQALGNGADPDKADAVLASAACVQDGDSLANDSLVVGTFRLAVASTLAELHQGRLYATADRSDVVPALEEAAQALFDADSSNTVIALGMPRAQSDFLQKAAHAALAARPSDRLLEAYQQLLGGQRESAELMSQAVQADSVLSEIFAELMQQASDMPDAVTAWLEVHQQPWQEAAPDVELEASSRHLPFLGAHTELTYTAEGADICWRKGPESTGWSGPGEAAGTVEVGPVDGFMTLGLICANSVGVVEHQLDLTVPVELSIGFRNEEGERPSAFALGDPVTVDFATNTDPVGACTLSRSDTGETLESASLVAEPGLTITATCDTPGGQVTRTDAIPVRAASLTWIAPATTENGELLTDLSGYRIYHGQAPGEYESDYIPVSDPEQVSLTLELEPGTRYFAVQAVTERGIASRLSNEVARHIP